MTEKINTHLANDLEQSAAMLDSREFDAVQLDNCASMMRYAATVIRQALADAALDKMADNAREMGLSYEQPAHVQYQRREIGEGGWMDCTKEQYERAGRSPQMDTRVIPPKPAPAQEPVAGGAELSNSISKKIIEQPCKYGNEPTSCTSSPMDCQCAIDAVFEQPRGEATLAQQEPEHVVHSNGRHSPLLTHMMNKRVTSNVKQVIELYDSPEQPAQQEPVAWGIIASNTGRICQVELDADEVEGHNPKHIVPLYTTPPAPAQPLTDEQKAVINAARAAMDASTEADDGNGSITISSELAASLSLCLDEYDRAIEAAHGITKGAP